jgi:hypothetical protein
MPKKDALSEKRKKLETLALNFIKCDESYRAKLGGPAAMERLRKSC